MITTLSDFESWVLVIGLIALMLLGMICAFSSIYPAVKIKRLTTGFALIISVCVFLVQARVTGNNTGIWVKGETGKFQEIPVTLWWRSELDKKLADGSVFKKQIPMLSKVLVFEGKNRWAVACWVNTPEQELTIIENLGLPREFKGLPNVMDNLVIQAFVRHGTNLVAYKDDPELKGIGVSSVEPYTEKIVAIVSKE